MLRKKLYIHTLINHDQAYNAKYWYMNNKKVHAHDRPLFHNHQVTPKPWVGSKEIISEFGTLKPFM